MKKCSLIISFVVLGFVLSSCVLSADPDSTLNSANYGPFIADPDLLNRTKTALENGIADSTVRMAYQDLINKADMTLDKGPFSVVDKTHIPPSGSKHDYMTIAPYYWPDPNSEDGLPYVYRDGNRNPETSEYDRETLLNFSSTVWTLSLAYYFTGEEVYAARVAFLVRYWFLKEETYMTPHLKFGQAIRGVAEGTKSGIIESRDFLKVLEGVSLIYDSPSWRKKDQFQLKVWFDNYLNWLLYSRMGRAEASVNNNHGTWYDLQVATFALFTGNKERTEIILEEYFNSRIKNQISAEGAQIKELDRSQSQHYTWFNLTAMLDLTALTRHIEEQEKPSADDQAFVQIAAVSEGASSEMFAALDWLAPYASGEQAWNEYEQIDNFDRCKYFEIYRRGAIYFNKPGYEQIAQELIQSGCADTKVLLLYPTN